ncbi:quinon protein alcohol dehydrogenase-like superfamily [Tribonema minus]|uniref:Quinon protein alcohol dehydrogenase-like superfamily n=1 Tax=Tribonema minus TaxID=303371 RepID=A0A835ZB21_9STRA|nr:quinon protein alcohol dehydrogenase-like superfamily [Tribonema minus]
MTAVLAHVHSFGLQSDCRSNIHFVDEGLVFYPCGSGSVLLSLETGEQQVVGGAAQGGITALGLSPNRRLLAVAERNPPDDEGVGTVYMYDVATLKRRKLLALPELGSDSIVAIAFSADGKMCLTQGAGPDWTLVLWNIEKAAKALCTVRTSAPMIGSAHAPPVRQADLCMTDPTLVCVSGDHILRFYRIAEGQLRPLNVNQKMELQDFMAHAWLPDERVALGTSTGDVLMLEGLEYHSTLMRPAGDTSERQAICCMAACGRGFVAGCVAGQLRIYERSDDPQELYRCQKVRMLEASPSGYPALTSIGVSPGEDTLAISTDTNQLYKVNLGSCDVQREDGGAGLFEHMGAPSHGPGPIQQTEGSIGGTRSARINAVDSCIWKPLVATVGADRTFRLWNYQTKVTASSLICLQLRFLRLPSDMPLTCDIALQCDGCLSK